jgi:hypothetical protein
VTFLVACLELARTGGQQTGQHTIILNFHFPLTLQRDFCLTKRMGFDPYFSSKVKVKEQPPPKPAPSLAAGVTGMKQKAATR